MLIAVSSIEYMETLSTPRKFKMNDILIKINKLSKNDDDTLYDFISEQLTHKSKDIKFWLSLAIVVIQPPFGDEEKGIAFIQKALAIDSKNPIALIILAHIYEYQLGGIDDVLLHKIRTLQTNSSEINSMLKYVASWSYSDGKKNNLKIEEQLLKKSILLCNKHVWNYMHLIRLYKRQKRYLEINNLTQKALNNIQKIYTDPYEENITDIDEFINEQIKGIYVTDSNAMFIKKELIPKYIIFIYSILTPFLYLYHCIKTKYFNR